MKIIAFHIDGFGMFRDFAVRELGDGLTVFYGPNEAGKSTLLDFIRYTLFGYPRKTKTANLHEPLCGGQHGGRIEVAGVGDKTVTIECFAGQSPSLGIFGDERMLHRVLHGMTRDTFEGYFAFDLDELRKERFEVPAELELTLLDAAQVGRMRSPASVHRDLADRRDSIYKKRGQKQPLIVALDKLGDLRREIKQCRERPREYEEKRRALEDIEKKTSQARAREAELRQSLEQLREVSAVRRLFLDWREAKKLFEQAEVVEDFPLGGVARLEKLDEELSRLLRDIEDKRTKIADLKRQQLVRPTDRRWLEQDAAIERLVRQRSAFEKRAEDLGKTQEELEAARRRAGECLARLGAGWNVEKVRAIATDLLAEDRLRVPLDRIRRIEQDLANERKEAEAEQRRLEGIESRLADQKKSAVGSGPLIGMTVGGMIALVATVVSLIQGQVVLAIVAFMVALCLGARLIWLWATAKEAAGRIEQQLAETRRTIEARQRQIKGLEADLDRERAGLWSALESVGLPPELSADTALEAFAQVRELQQALGESDRLAAAIKSERKAFHDFAEEIFTVAITLGAEIGGDWSSALGEIERRLQEERRAAEEGRQIANEIAAVEREIALLDQQREQGQKERSELLAAGGAPGDPELFRRRCEKATTYKEARDRFQQADAILIARCPTDEPAKRFLERLEQTNWTDVESRIAHLNSELNEVQNEHRLCLENRGRLDQEIKSIEQEERLFDLRQQEEATLARLAELARQWNVLAVADALMRRIQEIYDRERQPANIRRASELFRRFTRGRFERVKAVEEGDRKIILAVRPNLEELRPEALSRGTREQLYLALRLALVEELKEGGRVLPLIFDDILVNFDDERARATAETLAEIARDRQAWFFTAHEPTRALLHEVGVTREIRLDLLDSPAVHKGNS